MSGPRYRAIDIFKFYDDDKVSKFGRFLHILGPRPLKIGRNFQQTYSLAETDASGWVQEFPEPTKAEKPNVSFSERAYLSEQCFLF